MGYRENSSLHSLLTCHPEESLVVGDKVDILVPGQSPVHPVLEHLNKSLVGAQPERSEGERQRSSVAGVVTLKVVLEQGAELVSVLKYMYYCFNPCRS